MRNSLSHPTNININCKYPSTGYTSEKIINSESIEKLHFIDSQDIHANGKFILRDKERIINLIKDSNNKVPKGISYMLDPEGSESKYIMCNKDHQIFVRISRIELSSENLFRFTVSLCNYLAQATDKNWNGIDIKPLLKIAS